MFIGTKRSVTKTSGSFVSNQYKNVNKIPIKIKIAFLILVFDKVLSPFPQSLLIRHIQCTCNFYTCICMTYVHTSHLRTQSQNELSSFFNQYAWLLLAVNIRRQKFKQTDLRLRVARGKHIGIGNMGSVDGQAMEMLCNAVLNCRIDGSGLEAGTSILEKAKMKSKIELLCLISAQCALTGCE